MIKVIIGLSVFSFVLQAAHSMRSGDLSSVIIWLILPFFFTRKDGWMRIVLSYALLLSSAIWAVTGYELIRGRIAEGAPWIRLSVIIFTVAITALISSIIMLGETAKKRFSLNNEQAVRQTFVFIFVFIILELMRIKIPFMIILADRFFPGAGRLEIFLFSIYAAWLCGKMLDPQMSLKLRPRIWAFFSFVFFLQLIMGLAGLEKFLMTGKLHLPVPALIISGPIYRFSSFFMPVLFTSAVILAGSAWCSHLCYIGSWDDMFSRLHRDKIQPLPSWAKKGRIMIFLLAVLIPLGLRFFNVSIYTGLAIASVFGITGVLVMAMASRKMGIMAHCTAYCPIGLLADYLGKISPWRIRIKPECNQCMLCSKTCRYGALAKENLESNKPGITCTLCGDCVGACRNGHIHYSFPGLSREKARPLFISMIVVIHTIFLAVARI